MRHFLIVFRSTTLELGRREFCKGKQQETYFRNNLASTHNLPDEPTDSERISKKELGAGRVAQIDRDEASLDGRVYKKAMEVMERKLLDGWLLGASHLGGWQSVKLVRPETSRLPLNPVHRTTKPRRTSLELLCYRRFSCSVRSRTGT